MTNALFRVFRLAFCLYLAIVLQTVLAPKIAIFGVRPDFPFLVVLLVALFEGAVGGAVVGFLAGLFVGLNSAGALGVSSLANTMVAFGVGAMADRLERRGWITRALVALVATALRDQIEILLQTRDVGGSFAMFFRSSLPGGLYTAILAPPVMRAVEKITGWDKESSYSYR
jgi:rod shape-determining protein MreD